MSISIFLKFWVSCLLISNLKSHHFHFQTCLINFIFSFSSELKRDKCKFRQISIQKRFLDFYLKHITMIRYRNWEIIFPRLTRATKRARKFASGTMFFHFNFLTNMLLLCCITTSMRKLYILAWKENHINSA